VVNPVPSQISLVVPSYAHYVDVDTGSTYPEYIPELELCTIITDHPHQVLGHLVCLHLLVEFGQALGESILIPCSPRVTLNWSTRADGPFIRQAQ
jgi:hypothetical protein